MRMVLGSVVLVACAHPQPVVIASRAAPVVEQPAPAMPVEAPSETVDVAPPPATIVTLACPPSTPGVSITATNWTAIEDDLCVPASRAVARLNTTGLQSVQIDVVLTRVAVVGRRLSCAVELRVQPSGGSAAISRGAAQIMIANPQQLGSAADCVDPLVESVIARSVPAAVTTVAAPAAAAPWVPPALRAWQPIPSPAPPAPMPTTLAPPAP